MGTLLDKQRENGHRRGLCPGCGPLLTLLFFLPTLFEYGPAQKINSFYIVCFGFLQYLFSITLTGTFLDISWSPKASGSGPDLRAF